AWRYLLTTPSERRSAPAIWRCESPASYFSRSRSLSLRIEIGGADIESPFHGKRKKEMVSLKSPNLQRCRRVTKSETEIRRRLKKCSRWPGFGVHDAPDLVFTMARIRRSRWLGKCTALVVRFRLRYLRRFLQVIDCHRRISFVCYQSNKGMVLRASFLVKRKGTDICFFFS